MASCSVMYLTEISFVNRTHDVFFFCSAVPLTVSNRSVFTINWRNTNKNVNVEFKQPIAS
jgi:hypothetical protein